MICLRAFFRLLALSISCSLDRYAFPSEPDSPPLSPGLEPPLSWLGSEPAGTTCARVCLRASARLDAKLKLANSSLKGYVANKTPFKTVVLIRFCQEHLATAEALA